MIMNTTRHDQLYPWLPDQMKEHEFVCSPKPCKDKLHGLKRKFKEDITHNNRSGVEPRIMPFYDELAHLVEERHYVMPGYTAGRWVTPSVAGSGVGGDEEGRWARQSCRMLPGQVAERESSDEGALAVIGSQAK